MQHDSALVPDDLGMIMGPFRAKQLNTAILDWFVTCFPKDINEYRQNTTSKDRYLPKL